MPKEWPEDRGSRFTLRFAGSLFYSHVRLSVKWTSPSRIVNRHNSGVPLIVWGEGYTQQVLVEQPRFSVLFIILLLVHLIPVSKVGCLGKEHTSLHGNTAYLQLLLFGLSSQSSLTRWESVLRCLGFGRGASEGKRTLATSGVQGAHRPGSRGAGGGLCPTPVWACSPGGECWQKKYSLRVLPVCCVSSREISLSFSIQMSTWKISYGLCFLGW